MTNQPNKTGWPGSTHTQELVKSISDCPGLVYKIGTNVKIKTYGKVKIIRPYQLKNYIKKFKYINVLLAIIIIGLYPLPLALIINKIINKIKINQPIRW